MVDIVVGTDGSTPSEYAVEWAAREADRRGALLRVVTAYEWNWEAARSDDGGERWHRDTVARAGDVLRAAQDTARSVTPNVAVRGDAEGGDPAVVLVRSAESADLVVVGNRGLGGFTTLLLGSVGQRVAMHATGPVVVVRGRTHPNGPIVVGVDGSSGGTHALDVGYAAAAARGTHLVAIHAYQPPIALFAPIQCDLDELAAAERALLDDALAPWRDKYPQVPTEAVVAARPAAQALLDASPTAQLVVVGSRGHGSFAGTLLGSVGLQLLHHADCPVLIARPPAEKHR